MGDVVGGAVVPPLGSMTLSGFAGIKVVGLMVAPGIVDVTVAGANVGG